MDLRTWNVIVAIANITSSRTVQHMFWKLPFLYPDNEQKHDEIFQTHGWSGKISIRK